ncbi:MAG: hypothetical protein EZS28_010644 [Streblomastix strix]|uniref:Rhodanese domain-containing protein n=1 Tax=Streblomastix strix TaxID=222440 RepID=A0A5J4WFZ8_9EUKA|nr:MAG: hypothetical protein EZS28_010644 [Streblomastix strix]
MSKIPSIEPDQLADWLKNEPNKTILIDVRGLDYKNEKIPGSRHIEFTELCGIIKKLVKEFAKHNPPLLRVVFYCTFGRQRSPSGAYMFYKKSQIDMPKLDVFFLEGGLDGWKRKFEAVENMIETIT